MCSYITYINHIYFVNSCIFKLHNKQTYYTYIADITSTNSGGGAQSNHSVDGDLKKKRGGGCGNGGCLCKCISKILKCDIKLVITILMFLAIIVLLLIFCL